MTSHLPGREYRAVIATRTEEGSPAASYERRLLDDLRAGDERAFSELVERHHRAMVRLARLYVGSEALADEVVQEVWSVVVRGVHRFGGRSSLRTWLFSIVKNRARTTFAREQRFVPLSPIERSPGCPGASRRWSGCATSTAWTRRRSARSWA